jgi:hypothetical protein
MWVAEITMYSLAVTLITFGLAMTIASAFFGYSDGD